MTQEEAIEILMDLDTTLPQSSPERRREAVKMGISALTFCINVRRYPHQVQDLPIPGETKE